MASNPIDALLSFASSPNTSTVMRLTSVVGLLAAATSVTASAIFPDSPRHDAVAPCLSCSLRDRLSQPALISHELETKVWGGTDGRAEVLHQHTLSRSVLLRTPRREFLRASQCYEREEEEVER